MGETYRKLTPKQMLFVEAYAGDAEEAARIAGYSGEPYKLKSMGETLLCNPDIIEAIKMRSKLQKTAEEVVATRLERQSFWTSLMRNEDPYSKPEVDPSTGMSKPPPANVPLAMRLKASEMLGKSEADFMERIEHSGNVTLTDIISQSYEIPSIEVEGVAVHSKNELEGGNPSSPSASLEYTPYTEITGEEPNIEDLI